MIAITKVPVMYRLLENSGEPAKTADTRREHPPKEAEDRPGGACRRVRWKQPPPTICWEASDQRRGRNATRRVAFRAFCRGSSERVSLRVTVVPANEPRLPLDLLH